MVERIETDPTLTTDAVPAGGETGQEYPSVESLVRQQGVPVDRVEHIIKALSIAFSGKDQPTEGINERIAAYLEFKKARNGK